MSIIDINGLKQLSGDDDDFVNDILRLYLERTVIDLTELEKSLTSKDWNKLRFIIHRMRSSAVPLGLKDLVILLRKVENKLKINELEGVNSEVGLIISHSREALENAKNQLEMAQFT